MHRLHKDITLAPCILYIAIAIESCYNIGEVICMTVSKAQIKATTKYEAAKYDKILVRIPKGERAEVQAAADAAGESLNAYIVGAVKQRMERENADK